MNRKEKYLSLKESIIQSDIYTESKNNLLDICIKDLFENNTDEVCKYVLKKNPTIVSTSIIELKEDNIHFAYIDENFNKFIKHLKNPDLKPDKYFTSEVDKDTVTNAKKIFAYTDISKEEYINQYESFIKINNVDFANYVLTNYPTFSKIFTYGALEKFNIELYMEYKNICDDILISKILSSIIKSNSLLYRSFINTYEDKIIEKYKMNNDGDIDLSNRTDEIDYFILRQCSEEIIEFSIDNYELMKETIDNI